MPALLASLPMHLVCQLIVSGSSSIGNFSTNGVDMMASLPSGYEIVPETGAAYKLHTNKLPWNQARKQCILEGGHLAVINSIEKLEYVAKKKRVNEGVHVGIHNFFDAREWIDISSGLPVHFIPWDVNSPSTTTLTCGAVNVGGNGIANYKCTDARTFICEIPLAKLTRSSSQAPESPKTIVVPESE